MPPSGPPNGHGRSRSPSQLPRRAFLVATGLAATAGLAGCGRILDFVASKVLRDVNVFNQTSGELRGSIEITAPDGTTALSESFELTSVEATPPGGGSAGTETDTTANLARYDDVWQSAGDYDVAIELDQGYDVDGVSSASRTVAIEKPDEDMLFVMLGAEDVDEAIYFAVGDSLSALGKTTPS